jgi:hypothetical protein
MYEPMVEAMQGCWRWPAAACRKGGFRDAFRGGKRAKDYQQHNVFTNTNTRWRPGQSIFRAWRYWRIGCGTLVCILMVEKQDYVLLTG